jgi:predicted DNA-binding protein with PD1-like motif
VVQIFITETSTGTVSVNGSHLHISISDSTGKTIGGHLMEGCKIYTTAEIVILTCNEFIFKRKMEQSPGRSCRLSKRIIKTPCKENF